MWQSFPGGTPEVLGTILFFSALRWKHAFLNLSSLILETVSPNAFQGLQKLQLFCRLRGSKPKGESVCLASGTSKMNQMHLGHSR